VVLLADVLSVELVVSRALGLGVVVGNPLGLDATLDWLVRVANFPSIVLTFLAGRRSTPTTCVSG
jgi:hypothetical protein